MMKIVDGSEVDEGNYIPVDESKLKEDQQTDLLDAVERYKRESSNHTAPPDLVTWSRSLTSQSSSHCRRHSVKIR